jgi:hypothetical protein
MGGEGRKGLLFFQGKVEVPIIKGHSVKFFIMSAPFFSTSLVARFLNKLRMIEKGFFSNLIEKT